MVTAPLSKTVTEGGGSQRYTVVLGSKPTDDVLVDVDTTLQGTENSLSPSDLTFTDLTWNVVQTVTVTGVDDDVVDGPISFTVSFANGDSTDTKYDALVPSLVSDTLTNLDNDVAGIVVSSPSGGFTTEAGGSVTFSVVLSSEPIDTVTVALSLTVPEEASLNVTSLDFTAGSWNVPQVVRVTGDDDSVDDGNIPFQVTVGFGSSTGDSNYDGLRPTANVSLINNDDDTARVSLSAVSGSTTTEGGGLVQFTIVLESEPTAGVSIPVTSSAPLEGAITSGPIAFTTMNWMTPQTVTVTGQDDDVDDGNIGYTVNVGTPTSADGKYAVPVSGGTIPLTNVDNDTADLRVTLPAPDTVREDGTADTNFSVFLTSEPLGAVVVPISSGDDSQVTVNTTQVVFGPGNWTVPIVVAVGGVDDDVDDDDVAVTITVGPASSGADAKYDGRSPSDAVVVTNLDDDTARVSLSAVSGSTTTEGGGLVQFTIVLESEPTAGVSIPVTSSAPLEGAITSGPIAFTTMNWMTPQTVTVTGQDDDVDDGNVGYTVNVGTPTSADGKYAVPVSGGTIPLTNVDNDTADLRVVLPAAPGEVSEDGVSTVTSFAVFITSEPTDAVSVAVATGDATESTTNVTLIVWDAGNWTSAVTVGISGVDDDVDDDNVAHVISVGPADSGDPKYDGRSPADTVTITTVDDETAAVVASAVALTTSESGASILLTLELSSMPLANVSVGVVSNDLTEGTVDPSAVTWAPSTWTELKTVTVTGVDDDLDDANVAYTVKANDAVSADPSYDGLPVSGGTFSLTNLDNDTSSVVVVPPSGLLETDEVGTTKTFTVVLSSEPRGGASVTIDLSVSMVSAASLSASSLVFDAGDWNVPQTVTITGLPEDIDDGQVAYTVTVGPVTSSDAKYNGLSPLPSSFGLIQRDDDTAGIVVTSPLGLILAENGSFPTQHIGVVLTSEPLVDVVVGASVVTGGTQATLAPALLTFSSGDWNVVQTFTAAVILDDVDDGDALFEVVLGNAAAAGDGKYHGLPPVPKKNFVFEVLDDDTATVEVSFGGAPLPLNVTETGLVEANFTVVLGASPPAGTVVSVPLVSSNTGEVALSRSVVYFDASNWTEPVLVVASGINDYVDDADVEVTVSVGPAGGGAAVGAFNGLAAIPASFRIINIAQVTTSLIVGLASNPTDEFGATATFPVSLSHQPAGAVTLTISSLDPREVRVVTTTVDFGPTDWSSPRNVTVYGVEDNAPDGNKPVGVQVSASGSPEYDGKTAIVTVTNLNVNFASVNLSISTATIEECGLNVTFTVHLDDAPSRTVLVPLRSSDPSEGVPVPNLLSFDADGGWAIPQV